MRISVGGHRVSDSSIDGGRFSPSSLVPSSPLPLVPGGPYSCVVVAHPLSVEHHTSSAAAAAAVAAAAAAFVSPLPQAPGTNPPTPPSPACCSLAPSSSSISSVGACRIHEHQFTCPPPPASVTSGTLDRCLFSTLPGEDGEMNIMPSRNDGHMWMSNHDSSEEIKEEESVKQLLISLQKQVSVMSLNLSRKIDEMQCYQHTNTGSELQAIRTQLKGLTKSVESCHSEVVEVKRDMVSVKHEIDTLQEAKVKIEGLRTVVDQLDKNNKKKKPLNMLQYHQGLTCFLCYSIFAAVLGMFQFGYNTGVINAPQSVLKRFIRDCWKKRYGPSRDIPDDFIFAVSVSIFAIGGMAGGFSGGYVSSKFGRKRGLLFNNVFGIAGAFLMGFSKFSMSYEMFIVGRLVIGINCGLNTSLVPMYISEIAPVTLRGGMGTINQLAVTIGLLVSQILGLKQLLGNESAWGILLGLAIIPAIMQLVLLPVCPESPRYLLISKKREDDARRALRRLRACSNVEEDVEEMRAEEIANKSDSQIGMIQLLTSRKLRMPLIIGIVMQLSQQFSGINAVLYYSTQLFTDAGIMEEMARYATLGVGAVMVTMTLVSIPLMDRKGRRSLHLTGLGGMFIFSVFITISFLIKEMLEWLKYIAILSTLCFVIFFAVGPGSIPWMITAELFSQGPRPAAMSIAVLINWLSNFVVGIVFPTMQKKFDNYTFLPFSCLLGMFWLFTFHKVPETKNKTFEEISAIFQRGAERGTLNCVNTYGSKSLENENASLIRGINSSRSQQSLSNHSEGSDDSNNGRCSGSGDSYGGSSRAESSETSSRSSSRASSQPSSSPSSRQSVIAQRIPHPSEPHV